MLRCSDLCQGTIFRINDIRTKKGGQITDSKLRNYHSKKGIRDGLEAKRIIKENPVLCEKLKNQEEGHLEEYYRNLKIYEDKIKTFAPINNEYNRNRISKRNQKDIINLRLSFENYKKGFLKGFNPDRVGANTSVDVCKSGKAIDGKKRGSIKLIENPVIPKTDDKKIIIEPK